MNDRMLAYLFVFETWDGTVTSEQISAITGVNSTQVRRDLSRLLGHTGTRGLGYDPAKMARLIREWGTGEIGSAAVVLIAAALARGDDGPVGNDQVSELLRVAVEIAREADRRLLQGRAVPVV